MKVVDSYYNSKGVSKMFNTKKQIEYWTSGAISNIETAEILITGKRYLEGLFYCHLTIEKIFKALVIKNTVS